MSDAQEEGTPLAPDPRKMTAAQVEALGFRKKPVLRVIREKCIDCCCGNEAEVRRCGSKSCALWPYRMASNPFRVEMPEELRAAAAARLAENRPNPNKGDES